MSLDGFIAGPYDGPERPLGKGGWLKALRLAEYASRKPQQPQALAASPVPYASVRLRRMTSRSSLVKAALSCGRPCQAAGVL